MATPTPIDVAVGTAVSEISPQKPDTPSRSATSVPQGKSVTSPFYLSREQLLGRCTATVQPSPYRVAAPR